MAVVNLHSCMFRKSNNDSQINLFGGVPSMLEGKSKKQFDDTTAWHNQFRAQIISRIDESPYKVLYSDRMGAPNPPVSLLRGMMILKEAMNWSDLQLFEQCRFNILVRSALGLFNLNDEIPAESTYYLLRKRIYYHSKQNLVYSHIWHQTFYCKRLIIMPLYKSKSILKYNQYEKKSY